MKKKKMKEKKIEEKEKKLDLILGIILGNKMKHFSTS